MNETLRMLVALAACSALVVLCMAMIGIPIFNKDFWFENKEWNADRRCTILARSRDTDLLRQKRYDECVEAEMWEPAAPIE